MSSVRTWMSPARLALPAPGLKYSAERPRAAATFISSVSAWFFISA